MAFFGRKRYSKDEYKIICRLCKRNIKSIDYKDTDTLKRFTTERGKIAPRKFTKLCAQHQRRIATAIKKSRSIALLPFSI
ncbi:MAG: 30S ribosomal protein S18 [bacterium]|nr:30S ribosomal protein S18 [bacterium]